MMKNRGKIEIEETILYFDDEFSNYFFLDVSLMRVYIEKSCKENSFTKTCNISSEFLETSLITNIWKRG